MTKNKTLQDYEFDTYIFLLVSNQQDQGEESRRSLPKQTRWRMRPKSRIFPFFSESRDVHV
jgi:hypothetical protein